jgi:hypothetical protein
LNSIIPALTLTSSVSSQVRVDGMVQFVPTDAWLTSDTIKLTNTSQLYFDVPSTGQPQRLYRLVNVPRKNSLKQHTWDLGDD